MGEVEITPRYRVKEKEVFFIDFSFTTLIEILDT